MNKTELQLNFIIQMFMDLCLVSKPSEFQNSDAIQFVQIQIYGLVWWLDFMMAGNNMLDSSSLDVLDVCKHEKSSSPRIWKKSFLSSQSFMISLRKKICSNWSYITLTSRKLTNISSWGLLTHFLHWHWSLLSRVMVRRTRLGFGWSVVSQF